MNYNDYNKAITAEDLIRRYNLDNLSSDRKNIKETKKELEKVNHTTNQFAESVLKSIEELQDQVDGNITTWFFSEVPTLENYPASDWTTDEEKNNHLGDLYYDNSTGYAYRFTLENQEYKWLKIVDSDVVEALAIANAAQDTADKKRQVFVVTPTPPYDVGDMWIKEDKEIYRCRAKRIEGEYSENDWIKATDYTNDDYAKNVEAVLNQFKNTVESDYATKVLLETTVDSINASVEAVTTKTEILENKLTGKSDVKNVEELTQRVDTVQTATSQNTTAIEKLKVNDEVQSQKITEFEITVDGVTSEVSEQNDKISKVTQTVEELNSKIGDIADITTSKESDAASLEFEGINQSEPIRIVIRPIGENISYLYPHDNLFPSDVLFLKDRTIRFKNNTTNESIDYELPDDLLYFDATNYDEFILDYDGQSCIVNKRVGYNADGTTYILDNPMTVEYDYPRIELPDGDYEISVLGYENAYIFVRLMAQNIYTTQFTTKAEMNSKITQTAKDITLAVDEKLENYSTTTEMNSAIEVSANKITNAVKETYTTKTELENTTTNFNSKIEQTSKDITNTVSATYETKENAQKQYTQIQQTTNKISLDVSNKVGNNEVISSINNAIVEGQGVIELKSNSVIIDSDNCKLTKEGNIKVTNAEVSGKITSFNGTIGGWNIDDNGINNGTLFINSNGYSTVYTVADYFILQMILLGIIQTPNSSSPQFKHFDFNNDGELNSIDLLYLQHMLKMD